jgi:hypothetical protein
VFNAWRIKTLYVFDKLAGVLSIDERSFTRRIQEIYPLEAVDSISVRRLPSAPLGGASSFGMFIGLQDTEYLAASGNDEGAVSQDAWRLSRFLGLPLELPRREDTSGRIAQKWS